MRILITKSWRAHSVDVRLNDEAVQMVRRDALKNYMARLGDFFPDAQRPESVELVVMVDGIDPHELLAAFNEAADAATGE